jgi:DNA-binding GntR family transcriptional regulator
MDEVYRSRSRMRHHRIGVSSASPVNRAMRSATGDLKPWARITQRELAEAHRVPASVARNAIAELTAAGILGHYGGGTTVIARDIVRSHDRTRRTARILDLVALHIADLEAEIATLRTQADPVQAGTPDRRNR